MTRDWSDAPPVLASWVVADSAMYASHRYRFEREVPGFPEAVVIDSAGAEYRPSVFRISGGAGYPAEISIRPDRAWAYPVTIELRLPAARAGSTKEAV